MANPIERIKQLDQEREQLLSVAKNAAVEKVNAAIAELNALGFSYRLVESGGRKAVRNGAGRGAIKDSPCPVCKFKTNPRHDARRHRRQKRKKPFTVGELSVMGLAKV